MASLIAKPFIALWQLFAFEMPVHLVSTATAQEIGERLERLISAPRSMHKVERKKPLRGRVSQAGGFVRWPLNEYRFVSPRSIQFQIVQTTGGTELTGSFKVWFAFRVFAFGWLCFAILGNLFEAAWYAWHNHRYKLAGESLLRIVVCFCMAYGYTWLAVRVGRSRERQLVKVLAHTLSDPASAEIMRDLLTT